MKKLFAMLLAAAMLLTLAACAGGETETAAETADTVAETTGAEETTEAATEETTEAATEEVTTEEEVTGEVLTEEITTEEVTAEEVTTEEVTTEEVTTEEVTTEEVTTEEVTTQEVTTEAETQPAADDKYEFEGMTLTKPAGYTFKDFSGLPSGLKNGTPDGTCFFNFGTTDPVIPMTEEDVTPFLDSVALSLPIGAYTVDGFKSYEVNGHTVTKLDYSWENRAIIQSVVRVHFDDYTIVINFATLPTIPEGVTEFNTMIDSMTID